MLPLPTRHTAQPPLLHELRPIVQTLWSYSSRPKSGVTKAPHEGLVTTATGTDLRCMNVMWQGRSRAEESVDSVMLVVNKI